MDIFKICSADRTIREVVVAEPTLQALKTAAFNLLKKPILNILLESSGCKISSDLVLKHVKAEMLMVLSSYEVWSPQLEEIAYQENPEEMETQQDIKNEQEMLTDAHNTTENGTSDVLIEVLIPDDSTGSQEQDGDGDKDRPDITHFDETAKADDTTDNESSNMSVDVSIPVNGSRENLIINTTKIESVAICLPSAPTTEQELTLPREPTSSIEEHSGQLESTSESSTGEPTSSAQVHPDQQEPTPESSTGEPTSAAKVHPDQQEPTPESSKKKLPPSASFNKKRSSVCMQFDDFEIKWDKLEDDVNARLEQLDTLARNKEMIISRSSVMKCDRISLINMVVGQLRQTDVNVPACVMEAVAKKIVEKFNCFQFVDDDGVYDADRGWLTIKSYLIDRNNYKNRPKRPNQKRVTATEAKHMRNTHAGTNASYWSKETPDCEASIRSKLKRDDPNVLTDEIMSESIGFIRHLLGQKIALSQILTDWPVVRRRKLLEFHFEQATGVKLSDLSSYFSAKRNKILKFSQNIKKDSNLDENSSDFDYFTFICEHLKEKVDDICVARELGTQLNEIHLSPGPGLVSVDLGAGQSIYYVFAENARLSEGASSFLIGLQDLFGVLFVHNFMYPKSCSKTLDFVQQYLLKIIPKFGSKSRATRVGKQQRIVNRFIDDLSAVDNTNEQ